MMRAAWLRAQRGAGAGIPEIRGLLLALAFGAVLLVAAVVLL